MKTPKIRRLSKVKDIKNKEISRDCFLIADNRQRVNVCRSLFLATFALGHDRFSCWTKDDELIKVKRRTKAKLHTAIVPAEEALSDQNDHIDTLFKNERKRKFAENWIDKLSKVPSHYSRACSSKTYIDASFESMAGIHHLYVENCVENSQQPLDHITFTQILGHKNTAIHQPREDQCNICTGYSVSSVQQDEYEEHSMKKEATLAKNKAKALANETKVIVTMDLQSVLVCPKLQASLVNCRYIT